MAKKLTLMIIYKKIKNNPPSIVWHRAMEYVGVPYNGVGLVFI